MKKLALPGAFLLLACFACGEEPQSSGLCQTDADCPVLNPVCDFRTSQCVVGCDGSADCSGDSRFPVCNADGANNRAPAVCVCDVNSCPSGQDCQENGDCGTPTTCGTPGLQAGCRLGEVCLPAGTCAARCEEGGSTGCLSQELLCDPDTNRDSFNTCVSPQTATATLTSCAGHVANHARAPGGPILADIAAEPMTLSSTTCAGSLRSFRVEVVLAEDEDALPADLFDAGLRQLSSFGGQSRVFIDGDAANQPSAFPVPSTRGVYIVSFALCLAESQLSGPLAVFINDAEQEASNAACFTAE